MRVFIADDSRVIVERLADLLKEVSGVQYPMRVVTSGEGRKLFEIEIQEIEFLDRADDRVFSKP